MFMTAKSLRYQTIKKHVFSKSLRIIWESYKWQYNVMILLWPTSSLQPWKFRCKLVTSRRPNISFYPAILSIYEAVTVDLKCPHFTTGSCSEIAKEATGKYHIMWLLSWTVPIINKYVLVYSYTGKETE